MSSYMTAGEYLVDSHDPRLRNIVDKALPLLRNVIQNILDGYYQKVGNTQIHYIHLNDGSGPLLANIVGISLGDDDNAKFLTDRKSIQDCIKGVRGSIRILYEFNGEIIGVELSTIKDITKKKVFQIVPQSPRQENPDTPTIETSVINLPKRIVEEAIAA
ncbi:hypothetical protein K2X92_03160 [Candidatus Gracilibacteria bacterium]|nr:hypothetical protein [Candidatus Gracilibacteria bacterium]